MKSIHMLLLAILLPVFAFTQDVYEIKFTSNLTQHRAALILWSNGTGTIRVRYYSEGATRMVEQTIRKEITPNGLRLTGYYPVYPGTTVRYPTYSADNFYISQDEYGNLNCINIDDIGNWVVCTIRLITGYYTKSEFLSVFNWRL